MFFTQANALFSRHTKLSNKNSRRRTTKNQCKKWVAAKFKTADSLTIYHKILIKISLYLNKIGAGKKTFLVRLKRFHSNGHLKFFLPRHTSFTYDVFEGKKKLENRHHTLSFIKSLQKCVVFPRRQSTTVPLRFLRHYLNLRVQKHRSFPNSL